MLTQLKKIINSETIPQEQMRIKYSCMKKRSQHLTHELILKNPQKLNGQGCAYIGGFPV